MSSRQLDGELPAIPPPLLPLKRKRLATLLTPIPLNAPTSMAMFIDRMDDPPSIPFNCGALAERTPPMMLFLVSMHPM
jgi:hypothetical protein